MGNYIQVSSKKVIVYEKTFNLAFRCFVSSQHFPNMNPKGYTRTTQKSKAFSRSALEYETWKSHVWESVIQEGRRQGIDLPRAQDGEKIFLYMHITYNNDVRSDPSNVFKGVEDALADVKVKKHGNGFIIPRIYKDDKNVEGSFSFEHNPRTPGVSISIYL